MEVTLIVMAVTQIFLSIAIVFLSLTQKDIRNSMQSLSEIFRELSSKCSQGEKNGKSSEN